MKNTLGTVLTEFNEMLTNNLKKPNKTQTIERKSIGKKESVEVLEYASICTVGSIEGFVNSDTKVYLDKNGFENLLAKFLSSKFDKVDFYIRHNEYSSYFITAYESSAKKFGFPDSDAKETFLTIADIKISTSNTPFGECSHYDFKNGNPMNYKVVSKVVFHDESDADITPVEFVTDYYQRIIDRENKDVTRALEAKKDFEEAIAKFGMSEDDFKELMTVHSTYNSLKRHIS